MKKNTKMNSNFKFFYVFIILIIQFFTNVNYWGMRANAYDTKTELEGVYISEENYETNMKNIVEPYLSNKLESGYIDGDEGVKLYYQKYIVENPKGNIVISHGLNENLEKYREIIYYFLKSGYNVYGIEHRGHGRSGSIGIADKTQVNVKYFNQYIVDFKTFMDKIVVPNNENKPMYLFAHSMGGAIGTKFLEDYPNYFSKAVLNAPMLEINTGKIPEFLSKIIVKFEIFIGNGGKYVLGKKPYTSEYNKETINTTSLNRYKYVHDIIDNNIDFQRGGPSYNWTNESFNITNEIVSKENASKVQAPVLLFQAGQDSMVKSGGQDEFAKNAKNCKIEIIDKARHEIYLERDEIQKPFTEKAINFYEAA